jgi:hypothetical protein
MVISIFAECVSDPPSASLSRRGILRLYTVIAAAIYLPPAILIGGIDRPRRGAVLVAGRVQFVFCAVPNIEAQVRGCPFTRRWGDSL